jgi:hypothetical protein
LKRKTNISRYRVHTKNSQLNRDFYDSDRVPQLHSSSYICVLLNQKMHSSPPLETGNDSNLYSCHSFYLWLAHAEGNNPLLSLPTYCVSITYMLHTLYYLVCSLCMYNFPASLNRWADARSCLRTRVTRCIWERIAQNVAQAFLGQNENITHTAEISSPILWAISVICTKLPKENSHPRSENSPNLVTLLRTSMISNREG